MWQALRDLDREWFLKLNGTGTEAWDGFWLFLSDKWLAIPFYLLLLLVAWRDLGWRRLLLLLLFVALLITCTDQLSNFFKVGVGRLRPCHDPALQPFVRLVKDSCGGRFGYFSAHAANALGLAAFFTTLWGRRRLGWGVLLLLWASAVGFSRVYLGVHFPFDVLTGFAAGALFGWLFARLFTFARQKWMP
ncbi:phosphatase PAP2 family protein [Robiginitalea sp. SC105]|uniref:phosphatase PAP2 family protein n=1 Tax=Robiginitalea sp. SC105 TaxID=2762332 RepID=UPI00163AAF00|nr:phosphatase PAP2 family protein [Robiginitalea sp. SC105]MBC2839977.1 phosphatase PAP2 family protein [Robiginitalea sp. SC105]